jgi:transposase
MTPEPPTVLYNYVLDFLSDRLLSPSRHSTADQRKQVHLLHRLGYSVKAISNEVYLTYKCVWYIINRTTATPLSPLTRRAFRNLDFEIIRSYIETSPETRQIPFKKVIRNLKLSYSDSTLRRFLKSYSYRDTV